ncbi:hypothetical protein [Nocardiopsis rhodophaea]|uniref:hypothetical protein n=1 Tax=Nocardiopsis rhodophaea TaxID=280238 RepID=UPI0031DC9601
MYNLPADWVREEDAGDGWVRYLGFHPSHPDVAAAEFLTYEHIPHDSALEDAADILSIGYPTDTDFKLDGSGATVVPGAEEALRTDLRQDFGRPEFETLHISDYAIRTRHGSVTAFRISAVKELVDNGARDNVVENLL